MTLDDLQYVPTTTLAAGQTMYRVQRTRSRPGTLAIGSLRVAPTSDPISRFALRGEAAGYFAESPETAIYESLVRREATVLSLANAERRSLLCLRTVQEVELLDLRPHASTWPVLQSLRFSATQALAQDARRAGFDGIAYLSAQQYGQDCFVVFGDQLRTFRLVWRRALLRSDGAAHQALAGAIRGGQIAVAP